MEALTRPKSRVKQFYSDFYSSSSEDEAEVFNFKSDSKWTQNVTPISPKLSKNQDLKDEALDIVFKRRIENLKSDNFLQIFFISLNKILHQKMTRKLIKM